MQKLLFLLVLTLVITNTVAAQMAPYCGQLSQADCALMRDGLESLSELHAATINRASLTTLNATNEVEQSFVINGVIGKLPDLQGLDYKRLVEFNADVTLTLDVFGDLPAFGPEGLPPHSAVQVRLVDGILFINLDSLVPPLQDTALNGWGHVELETLFAAYPTPQPAQQHPTPVDDPAPVHLVLGNDVADLVESFTPEVLDQFVTVIRQDGVFETKVDFAGMYAHPVFRDNLRERMQMSLERNPVPGRETINEEMMAHLASEIALIFPEPVTLYSITVDPETRLARGLSIWGMWDFYIMVMAGIHGTEISTWSQTQSMTVVEFEDFNSVELVTVPENSQPLKPEILYDIPALSLILPGSAASNS